MRGEPTVEVLDTKDGDARPPVLPPIPEAPARRGRAHAGMVYLAYPAGFSLALMLLWQIAVRALDVPTIILPAPTDILASMAENWRLLLEQAWPTTVEIVAGFVIAVVAALATAILITGIPVVDRMVRPLLVASLVVPKIAVAPLFVIWFGFGYTPKIIVVALIAYFPIVVDTALGLTSVPREMTLLMRSMGAGRIRGFAKITFPHALPNVFAGLKVGMALAVVGAIVAEFVQSSRGLGYLLLRANQNLDTPLFFAGIVAVTILGIVLYVVIEAAEALALRSRR